MDFACRKISRDEILKCSLGLTKSEIKILKFFINNSNEFYPTDDLSEKLNLKLSTIQKAVKKLHEKEICKL